LVELFHPSPTRGRVELGKLYEKKKKDEFDLTPYTFLTVKERGEMKD